MRRYLLCAVFVALAASAAIAAPAPLPRSATKSENARELAKLQGHWRFVRLSTYDAGGKVIGSTACYSVWMIHGNALYAGHVDAPVDRYGKLGSIKIDAGGRQRPPTLTIIKPNEEKDIWRYRLHGDRLTLKRDRVRHEKVVLSWAGDFQRTIR
jgi:hypothetical protein